MVRAILMRVCNTDVSASGPGFFGIINESTLWQYDEPFPRGGRHPRRVACQE